MHLEQGDKRFIGACVLLCVGFSLIGWFVWGPITSVVLLGLVMGILLTGQIESYRRSQLQYRHVQSLFSIFSLLKINAPLLLMAGWAIPPDFAATIISLIFEHKPRRVLELGSGTSTLITAYAIKAMGGGMVTSLEQKKQFAEQSLQNVRKHGLQDVATVIYAPMREVTLRGKTWLWYDTEPLREMRGIDMVIVDGPTQVGRQKLPRYPALPVLMHALSERTVVLVDDASRADVKQMVELWRKEFADFEYELLDTEQGAVIFRRRTNAAAPVEVKPEFIRG